MNIPKEELIAILAQFNPWWRKEKIPELPQWQRAAFKELFNWVATPPAPRAVMLSGARQVGKTTLLLQVIDLLIKQGIPASNILYVTFDHPIFKLAGLETVLEAWRELEPKAEGYEYLFLDEAQFIRDFGTWVKHQVDFNKNRRIVFTGSAMPLKSKDQESGVGRWHTLKIAPLSFYEYLQIKKITPLSPPEISSIYDLFNFSSSQFFRIGESAQNLIAHFHEYLIRGGFPQTALVENIVQSQRLLREDIIDKILKRDMTALFGVRRIIELEQTFIYLCMHTGGIQDFETLSKNLGVSKTTVQNFIDLLESSHLLYKLPPYGYGKEILRARYKLYLADPAISASILMKGKTILEDGASLGSAVESAVFSHLLAHTASNHLRFSYWRGPKEKEVDLVIEIGDKTIPLEVKYQSQEIFPRDLKGIAEFCNAKSISRGFIATKNPQTSGPLEIGPHTLMRLPACVLCYWLGQAELTRKPLLEE